MNYIKIMGVRNVGANSVDFEIEEGSEFHKSIKFYTDDDLENTRDMTNFTWEMSIKKAEDSEDEIIRLTDTNDRIDTSSQSEGKIVLIIDAQDTKELDFDTAVYDLESTSDGLTRRELEGFVYYDKEVTKDTL